MGPRSLKAGDRRDKVESAELLSTRGCQLSTGDCWYYLLLLFFPSICWHLRGYSFVYPPLPHSCVCLLPFCFFVYFPFSGGFGSSVVATARSCPCIATCIAAFFLFFFYFFFLYSLLWCLQCNRLRLLHSPTPRPHPSGASRAHPRLISLALLIICPLIFLLIFALLLLFRLRFRHFSTKG